MPELPDWHGNTNMGTYDANALTWAAMTNAVDILSVTALVGREVYLTDQAMSLFYRICTRTRYTLLSLTKKRKLLSSRFAYSEIKTKYKRNSVDLFRFGKYNSGKRG